MEYSSVNEILAANAEIRRRFVDLTAKISDSEAVALLEGEKWSLGQIVEHAAIVDRGIARVCRKLISDAQRAKKFSNGKLAASQKFKEAVDTIGKLKLEAPDQVQPKGNIPISSSLDMLSANASVFEELRSDLETYDLSDVTFPHPYFGDLTAIDWLILAGGHQMRHLKQIETVLTKIRPLKSPGQKEGDPTGVNTPN